MLDHPTHTQLREMKLDGMAFVGELIPRINP